MVNIPKQRFAREFKLYMWDNTAGKSQVAWRDESVELSLIPILDYNQSLTCILETGYTIRLLQAFPLCSFVKWWVERRIIVRFYPWSIQHWSGEGESSPLMIKSYQLKLPKIEDLQSWSIEMKNVTHSPTPPPPSHFNDGGKVAFRFEREFIIDLGEGGVFVQDWWSVNDSSPVHDPSFFSVLRKGFQIQIKY